MRAHLNGGLWDDQTIPLRGAFGRIVFPAAGSYVWRPGSSGELREYDFEPDSAPGLADLDCARAGYRQEGTG